ncbi:hypothetical protein phiAS5_ORF0280 [Aeromonas phage phiAS5]|uniref:Large polyvalent protein-associated domain-containing protein n=1 Tax=Aeromonas phage phiAS5 TaxID=879630 RepID=E1A234_9CAUD|nr:hypothetical protein phiAS5_ORF0280 [Aeromonas phage phiAS5]ADM80123.1 hypothetical protein phiAS5_ORF0280 [Aeromonas phage phiAS5]
MCYIQEVIETREADAEFKYMLLSRMKSDCEYFLGFGNRSTRALWAGNVAEQIEGMKALWNSFDTKPEWLTMEQIEEYETKMKGE